MSLLTDEPAAETVDLPPPPDPAVTTPPAAPEDAPGPATGRPARATEVAVAIERAEAELHAVTARVDVDLLDTREAAELARRADRLTRRATALRTELVGRAAEAGAVTGRSGRAVTPERWAANELGLKPSQAAEEVRTADRLKKSPKTRKAFRDGRLSAEQARQVAQAADLAPDQEDSLLDTAANAPSQLAGRCRDIRARAGGRDGEEARAARHRKRRRLVRSETEDLAAQVTMVMPALTGARFDALLQPFVQRSVDRARAEGRHDPAPALRLDALLDALDLANQALGGGRTGSQDTSSDADPTDDAGDRTDREAPGGSPRPSRAQRRRGARTNGRTTPRRSGRTTRWGGARPKVIVRVDLTVLLRGRALPGERLDLQVAGGPPVPLTLGQLGEILDDDPMVAFVLHDGVDVYRVAHPQRRPSPLQRSALEALHDRCADIDCRAFGNLEVDHLTPWTEDGPTSLENLAPLCGATHDAKTHRGRDLHRIPGSPLVTATPLGASPDRATDPRPPATP